MILNTVDLWTAFYDATKETNLKAFPTSFQSDSKIVSLSLETGYLSNDEVFKMVDILENNFYFVMDQMQDKMYADDDTVTYAKYNITIFERF